MRRIRGLSKATLAVAFFGAVGLVASASESATAPSTRISPSDRDAVIAQARAHWASAVGDWRSGQFDRALTEGQATLDLYHKVYGEQDNLDVAMALTGVGTCLWDLNRDDEALPKFQAAMEMYRRIYKNQDEEPLGIAIGSVGWCLHCLDRDEEALPYLRAALEMQQRIHKGQDAPNVVAAMQNLATCLDTLEHYQKALDEYRAALEMQRRIYKGEDRAELAQSEDNVAACLHQLGRSGEALGTYQLALEMRKRLFKGADRADVAQDVECVAGCLDDLGRSAEALPMYREALEMRRRIYGGRDARDIAASLNDTALCLDNLGRSAEALPMYQAALEMDKRLLNGSDDADLATDMNNVADCYSSLGHRDEALKMYRDAWQMRNRIYKGEDSPDVAESLGSIAWCLDGMGRSAEALPVYLAAMQMRGRIYEGKDHPDLAQSMNDVGICLSNLGRPAAALPMDQAALEMRQRIYSGQDHPDVATSMFSVAFDLSFLGRSGEALKMFQASTRMAERLKSPELFRYCSALGSMQLAMGQPEDAVKSFEESVDSLEQARSALGGDDQDRMNFMTANQGWDPFSGMVRAQLELNHADTAAEYLDRGRAKSLLDYLERGERLSNGDLLDPLEKKARLTNDAQELKEILDVRTAVSAAEDQVRQFTSRINHARSLSSDEGLAQIQELEPKLNLAYQQYADAHRRKFNLAGRTTFAEATTSVQIQSLLLPRQHLLMYSITARDAVALLISPAGQAISGTYLTEADGKTRLSGRALQELIRSYRQAVVQHGMNSVRGVRLAQTQTTTRPQEDMAEQGYKLFRQLMPEKIWRQIQGDDLVYVVPDSSMSGLPLEMLIPQKPASPEAKNNVYWLDQGPLLCYGPSAAALLELRRQEPDRGGKTYTHEAVLLGDPILQRNESDRPHLPPPRAGALVTSVPAGSSAEAIGLRKGAVIVAYGPIQVGAKGEFDSAVDQLELLHFHGRLDQTPKLKFWLDGQMLERELPLDTPPGVELTDMTAQLALELSPVHEQPTTAVATADAVAMRDASPTGYGALSPLPGTRKEVEGIYAVLTGRPYVDKGDDSVVVLLGEDATGQRLADAAKGARYLHLATHGLVEPGQNAIYSSVVLSQPEVVTPQDTGLLTLQDLFEHWWGRLDGTELVVLSACDSEGLDERGSNAMGGEGVYGLPWGFMYAGSPAVVASLWEVQDASTAELMQKFYRDMQSSPATNKLTAFTLARKQLKKDYPEPFFWAPFIYLGDPN
ncbi:MAG: tetratricopeptide repeat protein [Tepidisphaeraceae bacterium]